MRSHHDNVASHSKGYFFQINDYWTQGTIKSEASACNGKASTPANQVVDLWSGVGGAASLNGTAYEEVLFERFLMAALSKYNTTIASGSVASTKRPLFLHYAPHLVHDPYELPQADLDKFNFIARSQAGDLKGLRQVYVRVYIMFVTREGRRRGLTQTKVFPWLWGWCTRSRAVPVIHNVATRH